MTGSVRTFERGIALIVEGATEKMFYQVYLERCCDACPPAHMDKELLDGLKRQISAEKFMENLKSGKESL